MTSHPPHGIRVGRRLVVIRDGKFVRRTQKKGELRADGKDRRHDTTR